MERIIYTHAHTLPSLLTGEMAKRNKRSEQGKVEEWLYLEGKGKGGTRLDEHKLRRTAEGRQQK